MEIDGGGIVGEALVYGTIIASTLSALLFFIRVWRCGHLSFGEEAAKQMMEEE